MTESKSAYEEKAKAQLNAWQADIDKLKAKAEGAGADAQIQYKEKLDELRAQRDEVKQRLDKLQDSGNEAFADMKRGVDKAWSTMDDAIRQAWTRFS